MKRIPIKYFDRNMPRLEKIEVGDWIDLRVRDVKIFSFDGDPLDNAVPNDGNYFIYSKDLVVKIYTGVAMKLPDSYEAHVLPRGSTFKHTGLIQTNSMGIIDNSYCGDNDEWIIPMFALKDGSVEKYQRIAQFRIVKNMESVVFDEVDVLGTTDRNGFGSTGKL